MRSSICPTRPTRASRNGRTSISSSAIRRFWAARRCAANWATTTSMPCSASGASGCGPEADLCCYWFEKARRQIEEGKCQRAGLLATQGIRGGANRDVLKRIKETGDIFFAESDRDWILDGADVHVSMVGFDDGSGDGARAGRQAGRANHMRPDRRVADVTRPGGWPPTRHCLHGRYERRRIRHCGSRGPGDAAFSRTRTAGPIVGCRRPLDQRPGRDAPAAACGSSTSARGHGGAGRRCTKRRSSSSAATSSPSGRRTTREAYRECWWLHVEARSGMRESLEPLPRSSPQRRFPNIACSSGCSADPAGSSAHRLRSRRRLLLRRPAFAAFTSVGRRCKVRKSASAKSGLRYTPTTCFETFPFPQADRGDNGRPSRRRRRSWIACGATGSTRRSGCARKCWSSPARVDGPWARYVHDADAQRHRHGPLSAAGAERRGVRPASWRSGR